MVQRIKNLAKEYFDEIRETRRFLHQNPELSFQEQETSAFILEKLKKLKIPCQKGIAKTGLTGRIEGRNPGKRIIGLRADMDALPVTENNDLSYRSVNKGVMHACGHDIHMACLLGAAAILNKLKDDFEGTVLLVFQPGEELLPGGARMMLEEGVFKDHKPDLMLALHVQPDIESGFAGFREGQYMASNDEIYLTVSGKGGHAALPHQLSDTVLAASQIVVNLQQIASRNAKASIPTVLSIGKIIGSGATNVIPDVVKMEGTFRTMDESWRKTAHKRIESIARLTAESFGASCHTEIRYGYPVLNNDPKVTRQARQFSELYLGSGKIKDLEIRMTAEDFAFFSQEVPSCLFRLGVGDPAFKDPAGLHSADFTANEKALETGSGLLSWLTWSFLTGN